MITAAVAPDTGRLSPLRDPVAAARRGARYGTFTALYRLSWLACAALVALLYQDRLSALVACVAAMPLVLLVPLPRRQPRRSAPRPLPPTSPGDPL